jgi:tRNA pseudouridine55 synthase
MHGALLVDKPAGPTSHDIVAFARRTLKTPRIGHTGTLDPLATGLLVLLVGHATRLSRFLVTDEKEYVADVRLGIATATYDAQDLDVSKIGDRGSIMVTVDQVRAVLPEFLGTFPQLPPPFSAKKVDGVRAYKKARRHEPVDLKPVTVTVRELELLSDDARSSTLDARRSTLDPPSSTLDPRTLVRLRVVCSSGFYVRSLAHDLGRLLGCGAHLEGLRRTRAGQFRVVDALAPDAVEAAGPAIEGRLIGLNALLADMPAVTATDEGIRRATNGNTLAPAHLGTPLSEAHSDRRFRVLDASGGLLSVAESRGDGLLHPLLVRR